MSATTSSDLPNWLAQQKAKNAADGIGGNLLTPTPAAARPIWDPNNPVGTSNLLNQSVSMPSPDVSPVVRFYGRHPLTAADAASAARIADFATQFGPADVASIKALRPSASIPGPGSENALRPPPEALAAQSGPPDWVHFRLNPRGDPNAPGIEDRVSTTIPTAKGVTYDPHTTSDYRINIDAAKASSEAFPKNMTLLRDTAPDLPLKGLRNPGNMSEAAIEHMADNLVFLHDAFRDTHGQAVVDRSSNWYDGANARANRNAETYGYEPRQVAGAFANLSPQKDWYQNVSLGERMMDILDKQQNTAMTPGMDGWLSQYLDRVQADIDKKAAAGKDQSGRQAALDDQRMSHAGMRGVPFGKINDPDSQALWLRAYDEAHNSRDYPVITPEGDDAGLMLTDRGKPAQVGWGSFVEIKKAMSALRDASLENISRSLGGAHKVRNFYNNIISPNAPHDDTTIDTHASAAAHLRPLSGDDLQTNIDLGMKGSASNATGSKGAYGLVHEAYRRAAERLGLLPRQLQSITWEAARGLFGAEDKRDVANFNGNHDIWQAFRNGRMTADEARRAVLDHAGGIDPPSWHQPPPGAPTQ